MASHMRLLSRTTTMLKSRQLLRPLSSPLWTRWMSSVEQPPSNQRTQEEASQWVKEQLKKGYYSIGKYPHDPFMDKVSAHISVFVVVTVVISMVYFSWYRPDFSQRQWAMREAYLVLREREEKGLPLVDKNLIDPSKFELPSDEELVNDMVIV